MEQEFKLKALRQSSLPSVTELVYCELYDRIVGLQLLPGTKLSEVDVATQLEVSRQPVRDAFYRLSQQGFLLIRPQRATIVTKISESRMHRAIFIRTALELEALRTMMAKVDTKAIHLLEKNLGRQKEAIKNNDRDQFHGLDDGLHALICNIAGHPEVWELIRNNKAHMDRVRFLSLTKNSKIIACEEHTKILNAIRLGNAEQAISEMRAHLGRVGTVITSIRAEHHNFFDEE